MNPLSAVVPRAIASLLGEAALSPGKVQFAWAVVVGPAVQRATAVRLEQGVLIVEASSAQWSREVARSARVIVPRMQALLGADAVTTLQIRTVDHA